MPMRGDPFHNFLAKTTKQIVSQFLDQVYLEYCFSRDESKAFFDVFGRKGNLVLAFEVETTGRHAVDNAKKAAIAGVPLWFVVPDRRVKSEITRTLNPLAIKPAGEVIKILLLGQLRQELKSYVSLFIPANRLKDKE